MKLTLAIFLLAPLALAQTRYAVGKQRPGPLHLYSVSASGEVSQVQETSISSFGAEALVDQGGRAAVIRAQGGVHVHRITPDHQLILASRSSSETGSSFQQSLAMSQDGRMVLALRYTASPEHWEFCTFVINNRLQLRATGYQMDAEPLGGIANWMMSDQGQYSGIINLASQHLLATLHISPSGEITDTGRRTATPADHIVVPLDLSLDGRWLLTGYQINDPDVSLFEISPEGQVIHRDSHEYAESNSTYAGRLRPGLAGALIASSPGLASVAFNPDFTFGPVLDQEVVGGGVPSGLAVSPDGGMVLMDDQAGVGSFPLFSFFLNPDGTLTPTGYSLPRTFKHADLRFIPDPTPVTLAGDTNLDCLVDSADVTFLINEAMPDDKPILYPPNFANADLDQDIDVDQDDLEALVRMLLGE